MKIPIFDIIIDTREKNPWSFEHEEYVNSSISQKLDTGDYAIQGLEDKLCIERKQSVAELAQNLSQDRFKKELTRMEEIEHRFLLLEFSMNDIIDYPIGSDVPKRMWDKLRVKGPNILGFLDSIQINRHINIIFCNNHTNGKDTAYRLMKKCQIKYSQ